MMDLQPGQISRSEAEALRLLHAKYDDGIGSGLYIPFTYPWVTFGAFLCFLYLLVPHNHSNFLKFMRYPIWLLNASLSFYLILYSRARNSAPSFAVGLVAAWSLIWTATLMIFNDAQTDFKRIERSEGAHRRSKSFGNGALHKKDDDAPKADLRDDVDTTSELNGHASGSPAYSGNYSWQSYPIAPFIERLDWVTDLFCNFRGMGWNWRISTIPPPPPWIQEQIDKDSSEPVRPAKPTRLGLDGTRRYDNRGERLRQALLNFVKGYLAIDLLKVTITLDPYYWGRIDAPGPSFLPEFIRVSPVLTKAYRLTVCLYAIKTALTWFFDMAPIFFVGLLGSDLIGARGEPWLYPDAFGSFSNVLDKGLAGWWGGWWHQSFRFAFEAPAKKLIDAYGWNPKSTSAKLLHLVVAFTLSGFLHAAGSYTQIGDTNPLSGPFLFFELQTFGIIFQMLLIRLLRGAGIVQKSPKIIRRLGNFVYVHVWFYYTAPLLCDDFSRGGIWLFEPMPISPLRALGFGPEGASWWCWTHQEDSWFFKWHRGKHWWQSGIAF
ncbi:membrane bound O-acyl transferase family-domain-containing protein [Phyllosticta citriasiana]|uniref:Membrane bound O-acyl transferase family-domain-containing protein n=1 Tax=Phyllosticta citriasiana TaxID=595635 RepID=A0ABR1L0K9_9PEZI